MQMCIIAEFYQGIKKIINMPETKLYFLQASLKFKLEFVRMLITENMISPPADEFPQPKKMSKWKESLFSTIKSKPYSCIH